MRVVTSEELHTNLIPGRTYDIEVLESTYILCKV